jgi:hypothetical protein
MTVVVSDLVNGPAWVAAQYGTGSGALGPTACIFGSGSLNVPAGYGVWVWVPLTGSLPCGSHPTADATAGTLTAFYADS